MYCLIKPFTEDLKACKIITSLFRDIYGMVWEYIQETETDMHRNKHQTHNCGYVCKGERECAGGGLQSRSQLYLKGFYLNSLVDTQMLVIVFPILWECLKCFIVLLKGKIYKLKSHLLRNLQNFQEKD